jgi:hypothetical protein
VINPAGQNLGTPEGAVGKPSGMPSVQGSVRKMSLDKYTFQVAVIRTNLKHAVTQTPVAIPETRDAMLWQYSPNQRNGHIHDWPTRC